MIYLSGVSRPELRAALPSDFYGLIWTEKAYTSAQHVPGAIWAADNGCFSAKWDQDRWQTWLLRVRPVERCLFAVVPDVPGDAAATLARSLPYLDAIAGMGYRPAYALQNGQRADAVPWERIGAVFIGGSPECPPCGYVRPVTEFTRRACPSCALPLADWKLSRWAAELAFEAKGRGLWVHMGRANSRKRLARAAEMGVDSCDGTFLRWGAAGHNWQRLQQMMHLVATRPVLPIGQSKAVLT